jgi:hypothetical protein
MINGAHAIIYSKSSDADRSFLRDVLKLPHVDVGHGWLIFGLPPAEVAIHPSDENDLHRLYLMVDDIDAFIAAMKERGIACDPVSNQGWGLLTDVTLPGGGKLGVYQPRHARPKPMAVAAKKAAKPAAKKAAKKAAPAKARAGAKPKKKPSRR